MKTRQEQIEQIEKVLKDSVADYKHLKKKGVCYCYAETLIGYGYGDVSEYKAENERLTKILNSLTFSEKETDIFGKPVLLMFAGVKVEEAIKRVTEYNGLKAEIERLRTTLGQCNTELNSALESLKRQCREIGELKAKNEVLKVGVATAFTNGFSIARERVEKDIRRAQIDVLNKFKQKYGFYSCYAWSSVVKSLTEIIDEFIKEVEDGEDKG